MIFVDIKEFAQKTIQRFGTHDPFDICNQLGIVILYLPLGRMRGYCYSNENGKVVVLHDGLAEHEARVVCAHELGHVLLHPKMCIRDRARTFRLISSASRILASSSAVLSSCRSSADF